MQSRWRWAVLVLGAVHSASAMRSQAMNPDGISYLDMGEAFFAGDWSTAITSVWSPLYALILGLIIEVTDPGVRWEFVVVHAVNFGIFCFALFGFEFLWRSVLSGREDPDAPTADARLRFDWWLLGYALYAAVSLWLIPLRLATPDLLASGLIYFAAGLLLRLRQQRAEARTLALLGFVLGLAYLAKSIMAPLSLFFMAAVFLPGGRTRPSVTGVGALGLGFIVIASPWMLTLSLDRGRPTFGDAGRLTYAWYVNDVPSPHWHGDEIHGQPLHPSRVLHEDPPVYEFASPIGGTYPPTYDSAYWYEGVETPIRWEKQLGALARGVWFTTTILTQRLGMVFFMLGLIYFLGRSRSSRRRFDLGLIAIAGAAYGMYALVLMGGRYVGAFTVLLVTGLVYNLPTRLPRRSRTMMAPALWATVIAFAILLGGVTSMRVAEAYGFSPVPDASPPATTREFGPSWKAAKALAEAGVSPGEPVGVIGYAAGSFWARLADVRIIAEVPSPDVARFWAADAERKERVLAAFKQAGVSAVIAEPLEGVPVGAGWRSLGDTGLWFRTDFD